MTVQASAPEAAPPRDGLRAGRPFDLTQRQIEQALRERTRYRYVVPRVLRDGQGSVSRARAAPAMSTRMAG
ncbi:hypothetical protein [Paraburkholderia sp. BL6669N2]|uniref:hypothetical protein n=1 Tax=Paraburkholderia sp. BL6669N2 TaxID=1938807 RepID=UPI00268D3B0E|nr:hypothetical protein [Paraburkholderia sp. BL6669N2]